MKILVLGATGMLGHAVLRLFDQSVEYQVFGSVRSSAARCLLPDDLRPSVFTGVNVEDIDSLTRLFAVVHPNVVINCVGLVKQLAEVVDPLAAIPINSLFPHRLARLCDVAGARLIHMSTDCVFSGAKGNYTEDDTADATDLYGRSKFLGEVGYPNAITLRTSIIGHELQSAHGLVGWFLSQQEQCSGYTKAIFSGLPTVVLAQIIRDVVITRPNLSGVFHVAAQPISKYDLLKLIATVYRKQIEISPDDKLVIDRSLNAERFRAATGYVAPEWQSLIKTMHIFK